MDRGKQRQPMERAGKPFTAGYICAAIGIWAAILYSCSGAYHPQAARLPARAQIACNSDQSSDQTGEAP